MICFNGNKFKTLDDKLFFGNKRIAKIYYGNALIYPEPSTMNVVISNQMELGAQSSVGIWTVNISAPMSFTGDKFTALNVLIVEKPSDYMQYGVYPRFRIDVLSGKCYRNAYASTSTEDRMRADWVETDITYCDVYTSNLSFGFSIKANNVNDDYVISAITATATNCSIRTQNTWTG